MKKKILITGVNSYIGNSFSNICKKDFDITKISLRCDDWQSIDFSIFDSILHVAGIAHTSKDFSLISKYNAINTELTTELAKKAKRDGVKQFVFVSSVAVYGDSSPIGVDKIMSEDTDPIPDDIYGKSKLQAEINLNKLDDDSFNVAIIRSPLVHGETCKGNFTLLKKIALHSFIFPNIVNSRSVIYIDNLLNVIENIVLDCKRGLFLPQDEEYFCTSEFVVSYRKSLGKKTYLTKIFNPFIKLISKMIPSINKVFGNLRYKK